MHTDELSPLAKDFWAFSSSDFIAGAAAVKASVALADSPFVSYEHHLRQSLRDLLAARIEEAKDRGCFCGYFESVWPFGMQFGLPALELNASHLHGNFRGDLGATSQTGGDPRPR